MASVEFRDVNKFFDHGVHAIRNFSLKVDDGEMIVLVGPSGCGKSTLLRMVAGLETESSGEIRIGNESVSHLLPEQRDVALVFQNYALYPHMTVRKNLAFPLKMMKKDPAYITKQVEEVAVLLELMPYLNSKPGQLSGGQRQRVAMGRALVREPAVFLMDEPLSNLDAKLRIQMRSEITDLQKRLGTTTIFVTHDQVEAMTMGDRLAVIREGVLQQAGKPQEIYRHPSNVFVATFIGAPGMNLAAAILQQNNSGKIGFDLGGNHLQIPRDVINKHKTVQDHLNKELIIGLRPEAFVAADGVPESQRLQVRVSHTEEMGHELIVYFRVAADPLPQDIRRMLASDSFKFTGRDQMPSAPEKGLTMVARLPATLALKRDEKVMLGVRTETCYFFDRLGNIIAYS